MREIAGALVIPIRDRYCPGRPGQRGLCMNIVKWGVLHRAPRRFVMRWWCDECLLAKYRKKK